MGILGDKIAAAQEAKSNDINTFVWKGPKKEINGKMVQEEILLKDATEEQLKQFLAHCNSMLYSKDKDNPGRYPLLKIIKEQRDKCNAELYIRWLENKYKKDTPSPRKEYPRYLYQQDIRTILTNNRETFEKDKLDQYPIEQITNGVPTEFRDVTIALAQDACLGTLGDFNKKHLSLNFITKLGLWFTPAEMKDLTEKDENGKTRDRLDVIRERHGLKSVVNLYINPKGLTYTELRAMLNLKSKSRKYSDLTTDQLTTLRDRVLFFFEEEVEKHIKQWEERKSQILKVAELKGINVQQNLYIGGEQRVPHLLRNSYLSNVLGS